MIWTVGHSTHSLEEFLTILSAMDIELVADVRRFPGSRRFPHFNQDSLEADLPAHGLIYHSFPALGGRRRSAPDSPNVAWRHEAFRGYADYISSEEFASALFDLLFVASGLRTAIMCSEVLWWRCHRRLISDVLTSLGIDVTHIRDARKSEPHRLAPPARIVDGELSYRE